MASSRPTIAITGATGRLGGRVARRLAAARVPQRLVVRAPDLDSAETAQADYADPDATRRALDGIETIFMVSERRRPPGSRSTAPSSTRQWTPG
jgi:uncharacterized protein YbjT (DUF2867 family)